QQAQGIEEQRRLLRRDEYLGERAARVRPRRRQRSSERRQALVSGGVSGCVSNRESRTVRASVSPLHIRPCVLRLLAPLTLRMRTFPCGIYQMPRSIPLILSLSKDAAASCSAASAALSQENREIRERRAGRDLEEEVGDEAAVIAGVVDEVEEDVGAAHLALIAADEGEADRPLGRRLGERVAPAHVPGVDVVLCPPELRELRMEHGVERRNAVRAAFEMRLPDEIDDIEVIERV